MITYGRLGATVITVDEGFRISKFGRHRLTFDSAIQIPEAGFHISYAFAANRAPIRCLGELVIAFVVDAVPASHKDNCVRRSKHVISANGAIALCGIFDASVSRFDRYWHTNATSLHHIISNLQETSRR